MNKTMVDPRLPLRGLELIAEDGEPMESDWHRLAMNLLIECVHYLWRGRQDYFAGGNMFIYYNRDQARHRDFRGPDFFVVKGAARRSLRDYWAVWEEEGRFPNVIVELLSPRTAQEDRTTKKAIYEQIFQTPEYFIYDPHTYTLEGWRLTPAGYQALLPNMEDRLWSEELGVWIGKYVCQYLDTPARYLRFFDEQGRLIPIEREAVAEEARRANQRAEAEQQRADAAEAELVRLRALLAQQTPDKTNPPE